jgi:histidine phosphotransferase ChpT
LPRGGTATVSASTVDGQVLAQVVASGPSIKLRPEVAEGLAGNGMNDGLAGHWVQAYYLASFVGDAGGTVAFDLAAEALTIRVRLPA